MLKEIPDGIDETQETDNGLENSEAEALETATEAAVMVSAETETQEIPVALSEILNLTDSERQAYEQIGKMVDQQPLEGRIVGYKKGACNERLIPIND